MGKKLDALLGRNFKTDKFKPTINLAISRLAVLKNQRNARLRQSRSDVLQLLQLPDNHQRALLRVIYYDPFVKYNWRFVRISLILFNVVTS
jgi:hypothetical protein